MVLLSFSRYLKSLKVPQVIGGPSSTHQSTWPAFGQARDDMRDAKRVRPKLFDLATTEDLGVDHAKAFPFGSSRSEHDDSRGCLHHDHGLPTEQSIIPKPRASITCITLFQCRRTTPHGIWR
jgi:hypothetical protein